jgi:hypothetical protein
MIVIMNDCEPRSSRDTSATAVPSVAPKSGDVGAAQPPPSSPDSSAPVSMAKQPRRATVRPSPSKTRRGRIVVAALMCAVTGPSLGLAASSASAAPASTTTAPSSTAVGVGGSNARSGPAAGGATGTVDSVSKSKFTLTTSAGQKVTVDEASSTKYQKGTSSTSAGAITKGERVLVLGTTSATTIRATQVTVQTSGGAGSVASSTAAVIPFQRGASTASKQDGQIPANYSEGSGTIVSGAAANKATEAALAAYPGGVVDRVVKLSDGEYEVHYIGVNWPHHIFVDQGFQVVGAD